MAGLMGVIAFLSMWINNTAATSIMMPVALAISDELERHAKDYHDKKRAIQEATIAVNGKRIIKSNKCYVVRIWTRLPTGRLRREVIIAVTPK